MRKLSLKISRNFNQNVPRNLYIWTSELFRADVRAKNLKLLSLYISLLYFSCLAQYAHDGCESPYDSK